MTSEAVIIADKVKRWAPSPQEIAMGIMTMFWGGTYYLISIAMESCGPFFFVGIRFFMAACIVFCITGVKRCMDVTWAEMRAGALIGFCLVCGYILQTAGLKYIPSSSSAFITALYVPLVPIFEWIICRRAPSLSSWLGIGFSFTGLMLIAAPGGASGAAHGPDFDKGEWLTLAATVAIALEILFISMFSRGMDSRRLALIELLLGSAVAFIGMWLSHEHFPHFAWRWFGAALALAVLSAGVQLVMSWAQSTVPATKATLIYSSEPIWGGLAGKLVGDPLPPVTILGAALIVMGVVVSELRPNWMHFRPMFRGSALRSLRPSMKKFRASDSAPKGQADDSKSAFTPDPNFDLAEASKQNVLPPVTSGLPLADRKQ